MTAEILSTLSVISYIIAGICLVLAVLFWFAFGIPTIVGDLSGRNARKAIEKRRKANDLSGPKSYRSSSTNVARGKLTETAKPKEEPKKKQPQPAPVPDQEYRPETGLLADNRMDTYEPEQTELLDGGTEMLDGDTELLAEQDAFHTEELTGNSNGRKLTMINEVMLIHTDEVISW